MNLQGRKPTPAIERFEKLYIPEPNSGCWLWLGFLDKKGYPYFAPTKSKMIQAYRWSYEYFNASISAGLEPDHKCRVRSCVNPNHLEAVTHRENVFRGNSICAIYARKTHCKNGHPITPGNFYLIRGSRVCKACKAEEYRRQKRQGLR